MFLFAWKPNKRSSGDAGFSLMEMLVALSIMAMIAGLAGPRVLSALGGSKTKAASVQIEGLSTALDMYMSDIGEYPETDQGLDALHNEPIGQAGWAGPYLNTNETPKDPWGRPYIYKATSEADFPYTIISYGRDGRAGGTGEDADIYN